jgi:hypothetical protein
VTCYIDKRNYEKNYIEAFSLLQPKMHIQYCPLRWFASTIQNVLMALSLAINLAKLWGILWGRWWGFRRCRCKLGIVSRSVACRVEGTTWVTNAILVSASTMLVWTCPVCHFKFGQVAYVRLILARYVMYDVLWMPTLLCEFTMVFLGSLIVCITGIPSGNLRSPQLWYSHMLKFPCTRPLIPRFFTCGSL